MGEHPRLGDRVADWVTDHAGSRRVIFAHAVWWAIWLPTGLFGHDRFPFGFLTLVLSLEAIMLTLLVLMSQQRAADRDRAMIAKQANEVEEIDDLEHEDRIMLREVHQILRLQNRHMGIPETEESDA